jgi:hypothetical protein
LCGRYHQGDALTHGNTSRRLDRPCCAPPTTNRRPHRTHAALFASVGNTNTRRGSGTDINGTINRLNRPANGYGGHCGTTYARRNTDLQRCNGFLRPGRQGVTALFPGFLFVRAGYVTGPLIFVDGLHKRAIGWRRERHSTATRTEATADRQADHDTGNGRRHANPLHSGVSFLPLLLPNAARPLDSAWVWPTTVGRMPWAVPPSIPALMLRRWQLLRMAP